MGQFVGCLEGMGDACRALDYPIVSGNVSLYNETNGIGIPPTPAIGGIGLIDDIATQATVALQDEGDVLIVVGETNGHVGQSLYQELQTGEFNGAPPAVDLEVERKHGDAIRTLITEGRLKAVHDTSDGGLLVTVAEMCLAGKIGAQLSDISGNIPAGSFWFGEDQGRYVISIAASDSEALLADLAAKGIAAYQIGIATGKEISIAGDGSLPLEQLSEEFEAYLPNLLA